MNGVDSFMVVPVLAAELGQKLLAEETNGGLETRGKLLIFEGVKHRALDLVDQGPGH